MARLLVANLDCEASWAPRATAPSDAARARAADAGARLAVFGRPGDRLWLLGAPGEAARRAAEARGVVLEHGPLERVAPAARVLAWGETAAVARLRGDDGAPASAGPPSAAGLVDRAWAVRPSAAVVAARANDRRFALALADRIGVRLPGARPIEAIGELERHLEAGGATAGGGAFVLKAPWSAAGRDRLIHRGALDAAARTRAERLLERFGALCFEPWLDRTGDLGQGGVVDDRGVHLVAAHRTEVDRHGVFRAAAIDDRGDWLAPADRDVLERTAGAAGDALASLGYRGPFAIDAFHHRLAGGGVTLHPLCELNARLTFGLVARAEHDAAA